MAVSGGAMRVSATPEAPGAPQPNWAYWPEIDGLRTIAVLSVVMFHLARQMLPGGFVGVDIFFVISGFLISSILMDDIARRRFSIGRFYQRRISRIFPALILVILATLAAASFIYSAQDMASLGINSAAAATSLINMKLVTQGSYFILSADAQPLLHYWSLAVEEQFYVVFPLYLYLVTRFTKRPLVITAAIAVASFALCVWLTPGHQPLAFYSLPTRAWELLAGSSLALYRAGGGRVTGRAAQAMVWGGLALILGSIELLRDTGGFPGWIAAFPVIGTAMLIAPIGDARPAPLRFLAHPAMVAIGKRSYSLYLWHWPVFSLVDYQLFAASEPVRTTLKIVLTLALTMLSYRFVERPARLYLNVRSRRVPMFVVTALLVGVIASGGIWLRKALYFDVPPSTIASGGTVVHGGEKGVVILSGDSQAAMYGTEIAAIARRRHFTLYALGTAGRNQLPGEEDSSWPATARLIAAKKPDLVILVDAWGAKLKADPMALKRALDQIGSTAKQVLLVAEPPSLPDAANRDAIRHGLRPPFVEPAARREQRLAVLAPLHSMESARVHLIDVAPLLADRSGAIRLIAPDGRMTYYDTYHLSDDGTRMARPLLDRAIGQALGQ
ncbi:hypothetical protein GCM10009087_26620 [Sphingomonas oligophenolica]|uniref:Acyltransferase family protein n=1 Tax=Sphingomonas oligophenolica TaxID=301154 RepID=A0ABU9YD14_9SPHN